MSLAALGRLLLVWGVTQDGAPSLAIVLHGGIWRVQARAGGTQLEAAAATLEAATEALACAVRQSLALTLGTVAVVH